MKYIQVVIIAVFAFMGCQEVPVEIPKTDIKTSGKNVLIEELTGVECPNCPSGARAIKSIHEKYPDNTILVAIHGDFLCEPITKEGYESKYDFRVEEATSLETDYLTPFVAKPAMYFNRVKDPNSNFFGNSNGAGEWLALTEAELNKEQVLDIKGSCTYDEASRKAKLSLGIRPLKDITGDFMISVMVLESKIKDTQKDQEHVVKDFEHNHVLRDMVTPYRGEPLATSFENGTIVNKTFEYTLPEQEGLWIPEHVELVAFVSDISNGKKEVLQSFEVHVVEK